MHAIFLAVFRDQLYKHLEAVPEGDFEIVTSKLVQAGSTLDFLKYADALFDILICGGLLQPGGQYLDEDGPTSPFSVFQAKEPAQLEDIKKYVEVFNKLIRRCVPFSSLLPSNQLFPICGLLPRTLLKRFIYLVHQIQVSSEAVGDPVASYSLAVCQQMGRRAEGEIRHDHRSSHGSESCYRYLPFELDEGPSRQEWYVQYLDYLVFRI